MSFQEYLEKEEHLTIEEYNEKPEPVRCLIGQQYELYYEKQKKAV